MSDLLPCPFCGNEARIAYREAYSADSGFPFVGCEVCDAMIEGDDRDNCASAIAAWNRRSADRLAKAEALAVAANDVMLATGPGDRSDAARAKLRAALTAWRQP